MNDKFVPQALYSDLIGIERRNGQLLFLDNGETMQIPLADTKYWSRRDNNVPIRILFDEEGRLRYIGPRMNYLN
ncbi:MAG: hypothetical protein KF836_09485 [Fimbriimonadaceae bacterium]|nr:hypothetical protein [Fimbriimonadaceae bacterium]